MMQMALSNAVHPEYGVVTIPFPIPEEEYGHCLELLEALEIGNAVSRDCKVQEVQDGPPILSGWRGAGSIWMSWTIWPSGWTASRTRSWHSSKVRLSAMTIPISSTSST